MVVEVKWRHNENGHIQIKTITYITHWARGDWKQVKWGARSAMERGTNITCVTTAKRPCQYGRVIRSSSAVVIFHGEFSCISSNRRRMDFTEMRWSSGRLNSGTFDDQSWGTDRLYLQFPDETRWRFSCYVSEVRYAHLCYQIIRSRARKSQNPGTIYRISSFKTI